MEEDSRHCRVAKNFLVAPLWAVDAETSASNIIVHNRFHLESSAVAVATGGIKDRVDTCLSNNVFLGWNNFP